MPFLAPIIAAAGPALLSGGGTLAGGLLGSKLAGKSGDERAASGQMNSLANQLSSTANQFSPYATNFLNTAKGSFGSALNFWAPLLSGNRSAASSILAPDINRINEQFDSLLQSTAGQRTGAGASLYANLPYQRQSQIQSLFSGLRPQAAQAMGNLGSQVGQLGTQSIYAITNALGQAMGGQNALMNNAMSQKLYQQEAGKGLGGLFADLFGKLGGIFGGGKTDSET